MKIIQRLRSLILCFILAMMTSLAMGQDASHYETATSQDSGDWGLLGLLGLVGLLGLRRKRSPRGPATSKRV